MVSNLKPGLYLAKPQGKSYGLHIVNKPDLFHKVKEAFLEKRFDGLSPFLQSDCPPLWEHPSGDAQCYLFIEFWTDRQDHILDVAMSVASETGEELLLEEF
jgi:hypothetical protein